MSIRLSHIVSGYDNFRLNDVSLDFGVSGITALIGPNGCGKSTLLKTVSGHLNPRGGQVEVSGFDIAQLSNKRIAKLVSYLPQHPVLPPAISVRDLVGYGRAPHQNLFGFRSAEDDQKVDAAIEEVDLPDLADRPLASLSGGQRQRAFIAMCVAQDTPYLLFDEPTSFLDIRYQFEILDLLRTQAKSGKIILVVLHDIEQAARYADEIIVMNDGQAIERGNPMDVITAELLEDVFELRSTVFPDPNTGTPLISAVP
ncbi:MAG: ABC transporter ATP-binding protein [Pseudomonadota bacterium]